MAVERYCMNDGCPGGAGCTNKHRRAGESCSMEYVATEYEEKYRWGGEGPPPARWKAKDGTVVYRSFADYCH